MLHRFTWESEVLDFHSKYSETSCKLECKMKAASEKVDRLNQTIVNPYLRWVAFLGICLKSLENVSVGWLHFCIGSSRIYFSASQKLESSGKSWKGRNAPFAFRTAWISPTTAPSVRLRLCKRACCPIVSITLKKEPQALSSQALWFSELEPGPSLYSWQRWVNAQSMEDSGAQNFGQQRGNVTFTRVFLIRYLTDYLMKRWKMCTTKQATTQPCLTTSRTYQAPKGQNTMTT